MILFCLGYRLLILQTFCISSYLCVKVIYLWKQNVHGNYLYISECCFYVSNSDWKKQSYKNFKWASFTIAMLYNDGTLAWKECSVVKNTALTEDLGAVSSWWLTTACNSSSRRFNASSNLHGLLMHMVHRHTFWRIHMYTSNQMNIFKQKLL